VAHEHRIGPFTLELVTGDITDQPDVDAVINAANRDLAPGGGVAGAIHAAAGPELSRATASLGPIEVGEAVVTEGFGLPNAHIIHVLGPRYGIDEPATELLASCYRGALARAERLGLGSLACPAVSTGIFGFPVEPAADIALRTVLDAAPRLRALRLVRFVLFDEPATRVHADALTSLTT
jgi:O-acetyl-ADP-ribose deacetylase